MTTTHNSQSPDSVASRGRRSHLLASWGRDLASFGPADWGGIRRGRMVPAGRLHAVADNKTLCGLPLLGLYVFPALRFEEGAIGHQCPSCVVESRAMYR
jgi:hypothetical protein